MFCKNCGAEIADNAVFCPKCGSKVSPQAGPANFAGLRKVVIRILWEATRISRREARHRAR